MSHYLTYLACVIICPAFNRNMIHKCERFKKNIIYFNILVFDTPFDKKNYDNLVFIPYPIA